jgi:hypothetical protein
MYFIVVSIVVTARHVAGQTDDVRIFRISTGRKEFAHLPI